MLLYLNMDQKSQIKKELLELGFEEGSIDLALKFSLNKEEVVEIIIKMMEDASYAESLRNKFPDLNRVKSNDNENNINYLIRSSLNNLNNNNQINNNNNNQPLNFNLNLLEGNNQNQHNINNFQLLNNPQPANNNLLQLNNNHDNNLNRIDSGLVSSILVGLESIGNYKMVILVRRDIKMGIGKIAAQVGHAAYKEAKDDFNTICWESQGSAKIVLAVDNLDQLLKYFDMAKDNQINTCIIKDAGRTQIDAGTITVCAIGPAKNEQIDLITGKLSLL